MSDKLSVMNRMKINKSGPCEGRLHNSFAVLENSGEKTKKKITLKYKWVDSHTGHTLSAGGILFYDESGIWVIGEKEHGEIIYSDIGGKYEYEDGNIWNTIRREMYEETYGCCEVFSHEIVSISKKYPPIYVNGHKKTPVYACLVVPIAETLSFRTFSLDSDLFAARRLQTLRENPEVPPDYYPCMLIKLSYKDLRNHPKLSYRLQRILRFSETLNTRIHKAKI